MSLLGALGGFIFFSLSGALVGVTFLIGALWILGVLNATTFFVLSAAPLAALFAAWALEHALKGQKFRVDFGSMRELIFLLVILALLESSRTYEFLGRAVALQQTGGTVQATSVILSSIGGAISVGSVVVIACLLLVGVIELLIRWVFKVFDSKFWLPLDVFRPLLIIAMLGLGVHLLGDFFSSELSANAILKQASAKGN